MNRPTPAQSDALIVVIDDDEAVRDSLRWMLEGHGFRVKCHESAEAYLADLAGNTAAPIQCLIIDVRMPGISGLALQEQLGTRGSTVPVVLISGHGDIPMAVAGMRQGAVDFIEKPFTDQELMRAVERALERSRNPQPAAAVDAQARERIARLTQRERQVLERIVAGRLNKQIADDLTISIKTVEAHRANIMEKLQARTMAELMKTALRGGAS